MDSNFNNFLEAYNYVKSLGGIWKYPEPGYFIQIRPFYMNHLADLLFFHIGHKVSGTNRWKNNLLEYSDAHFFLHTYMYSTNTLKIQVKHYAEYKFDYYTMNGGLPRLDTYKVTKEQFEKALKREECLKTFITLL